MKELFLECDFDILIILEIWFNLFVFNSVVEIFGYQVYRFDCFGKVGVGVCVYVKFILKVKVLKDFIEIFEFGLYQLWI